MYLYKIIRSGEDCVELSSLFMRINIVEMHHLKIFGSLAILSGSNYVVQVHADGSHFRMCARQIFQHHAAVTAVLSGNAYGRIGFISGAAHIFEIGHRILLEMVLIQYMR